MKTCSAALLLSITYIGTSTMASPTPMLKTSLDHGESSQPIRERMTTEELINHLGIIKAQSLQDSASLLTSEHPSQEALERNLDRYQEYSPTNRYLRDTKWTQHIESMPASHKELIDKKTLSNMKKLKGWLQPSLISARPQDRQAEEFKLRFQHFQIDEMMDKSAPSQAKVPKI